MSAFCVLAAQPPVQATGGTAIGTWDPLYSCRRTGMLTFLQYNY
jgi:hypothetical protein